MDIEVYCIEDEDVLERFFGDNDNQPPVATLAKDFGTLIFEGPTELNVLAGDALLIDDAEGVPMEYGVILRIHNITEDVTVLICQERTVIDVTLSS